MLNTYAARSIRQLPANYCTHTLWDNQVHHLILMAPTHQAVENWRDHMDSLYGNARFFRLLTLTDARHSILPALAYATLLGDLWQRRQFDHIRSRNAILHAAGPLGALVDGLLQALPGYGDNPIRFFAPDQRAEAVRWLVSDD